MTLTPTGDVDLNQVVAHIRQLGFSGLCGVDPDKTIDMSIRAPNPRAAIERARSLQSPDYEGLFIIGHPPL